MNGLRYKAAHTPEARIAARIRRALYQLEEKNRLTGRAVIADYAELENYIRPEVRKESVKTLIQFIGEILEDPEVKQHDELHKVFMHKEQLFYLELVKLEEEIETHM